MIFVTVGTNEARFDRLLSAVAALPVDEPILVQHGHSQAIAPAHADVVDFLSFDDVVQSVRASRAVVTHAGVGSIIVSLANGKRPIVVPRLKAFAEAVDDHQLQLGRRFAADGLVTLVEDPADLPGALGAQHDAVRSIGGRSALAADLAGFLQTAVRGQGAEAIR
jgi:UDP-N-acetylglucosamine transferase subunit ALG13